MKDLFGENILEQKGCVDIDDYAAFVEKFKPKKTTDDCYTHPEIYDVVLNHVKRNVKLDGKRIVRPFVPGGDYTAIKYKEDDVVIDNPPFSILSSIITYYLAHNIHFFLFAPTLTLFSGTKLRCTSIICGVSVVYDNGACVNTSFCTNLYGDGSVIVDGKLYKELHAVNKKLKNKKTVSKISYPNSVASPSTLERIAKRGISFTIAKEDFRYVTKLDCGISLYGGGILLSDRASTQRAEAESLAIERAEAESLAIEIAEAKRLAENRAVLSKRELNIISSLGNENN